MDVQRRWTTALLLGASLLVGVFLAQSPDSHADDEAEQAAAVVWEQDLAAATQRAFETLSLIHI